MVHIPYKWYEVTDVWTFGAELFKMVLSYAHVGLWCTIPKKIQSNEGVGLW